MLQIIILSVIYFGSLFLVIRFIEDDDTQDFFFLLIGMVGAIPIMLHVVMWSCAPREYERFVAQRSAFERTLENARNHGNPYESAAILTEITEWNIELANRKYTNSRFWSDCYVDDRTEFLQEIE